MYKIRVQANVFVRELSHLMSSFDDGSQLKWESICIKN